MTKFSHRGELPLPRLVTVVFRHFWFKCFGTMAFTLAFFLGYVYLLKNPASAVTIMPHTALDRLVGFQPLALPVYLSLWVYVSLPPILMITRKEIVEFGAWIGSLCMVGLAIFYFWPNAVPPANIDWARYPGMAFLKGVDAAGNACPSLHVATAAFAGLWVHYLLPRVAAGSAARWFNAFWCIAIAYSTMATKQHVAVDVYAGAILGLAMGWLSLKFGSVQAVSGAI